MAHLLEVEVVERHPPPLRVGQRVLNRQHHIGLAEVSQQRSIGKLNQRMHDRLAVDDHLYLVDRYAKQPSSLDDFKALVHQGCRIHADLGTHFPSGVIDGLLWGDAAHLLATPPKERPPRGREDDPLQAVAVFALETLPNGIRLAVQRQHGPPTALGLLQNQPAGHDQGLLIGHGHNFALSQRRQRRTEADGPDEPIEH